MTAFEWLVLILSSTLAVLLVISIVLAVYLTKFAKHLSNISEKAERVADNVESASSFFKHSAGPMAMSKFVANIVETVANSQKEKQSKKKKDK